MKKSSFGPARNRLSAALFSALLLPVAGSALAQAQDNAGTTQAQQEENEGEATTLDRVTVTGSRIKRAHI